MANRYVRSTGGNWSAAGTWESASGLKDAVAAPTASDTCFCDAQSGQVTVDTATCVGLSLDCSNYTRTMTFTAAQKLTLSGDVKFVSGMTIAGIGILAFVAAANMTSGTKIFTGSLQFSSAHTRVLLAENYSDTIIETTTTTTTIITDPLPPE